MARVVRKIDGAAMLVVAGEEVEEIEFNIVVTEDHRGALRADGRIYASILAQDRAFHSEQVELRRSGRSIKIGVTDLTSGRAWCSIIASQDVLNF